MEKTFCATEEELVSACSDADAVIALGIKITPGYVFSTRVIENLHKCRLIALTGIGYDNVDIAAATEKASVLPIIPITVCRKSQTTLWHLFWPVPGSSQTHSGYQTGNGVPRGLFERPEAVASPIGQTLGLIGFGNIARAYPKSQSFWLQNHRLARMCLHCLRRSGGISGLDWLLEESDFVSMHTALTPESRHMMGLEQFKRMKAPLILSTPPGESSWMKGLSMLRFQKD